MPIFYKFLRGRNFWVGMGTALVVSAITPVVMRAAKPIASTGKKKVSPFSNKTAESDDFGTQLFKNEQFIKESNGDAQDLAIKEPMKHFNEYLNKDTSDLISLLKEKNQEVLQEIASLRNEVTNLRNQLNAQ